MRKSLWTWTVATALLVSFFIITPAAQADPPVITGFELTGGSRTLYTLPAIIPQGPFPPLPPPEPAHTFACGQRWIRVFGDNFDLGYPNIGQGATIRLFMSGAADIDVTVHDGGWVTMNPDFPDYFVGAVEAEIFVPQGQPGGLYSVEVINFNGESATLPDVLEVEGYCPRGRVGDLYVANVHGRDDEAGTLLSAGGTACQDCSAGGVCDPCWYNVAGNILQFDGQSGEFVCVFARSDTIIRPSDLVWGPNGNLFVLSIDQTGGTLSGLGKVVEFDGQTGQFVRILAYSAGWSSSLFPNGLDFGGPDANLFLLHGGDGWVREHDRATGAFLRKVIDADTSSNANLLRFGPNGNVLIGLDGCSTAPVLIEADPVSGNWIRVIVRGSDFGGCTGIYGLLYDAGTDTLLLPLTIRSDVVRVDFATGTVLETLIDHPANGPAGLLENAWDLAFGPAGNLFVSGQTSTSLFSPTEDYDISAIHEFDASTFEQVQVFGYGHFKEPEWDTKTRPHELWQVQRIIFKPLPGDWGGRMAGGDWQVDSFDYDRFVEAFNGGSNNRAKDLLAFDSDRDADVDCDDWGAFQLAWTAGGSPPPLAACAGYDPDPDGDGVHTDDDVCPGTAAGIPVDETGRPLADMNGDCAVDVSDFGLFQLSMTGPGVP